MKPIQAKLARKIDLSEKEAQELLDTLLSESVSDEEKANLLRLLADKGETVTEITACITGMRTHMQQIAAKDTFDTCGTGGDGKHTFNISTAVAFVVAAAGIPVAKHGNRAASSKCGSADVLEELGVNLILHPAQAKRCLKQAGIMFLFAPLYHPAMKAVIPARKQLQRPTIFNLLGPFLNPTNPRRQLIGVKNRATAALLAQVGKQLGYERLVLVSSRDGLDEVSPAGISDLFIIEGADMHTDEIDPEQYGLHPHSIDAIQGGDAAENASIMRTVLHGTPGAYRDTVVLNGAVALYAAGVVSTIADGVTRAQELLDTGAAAEKLAQLVQISTERV